MAKGRFLSRAWWTYLLEETVFGPILRWAGAPAVMAVASGWVASFAQLPWPYQALVAGAFGMAALVVVAFIYSGRRRKPDPMAGMPASGSALIKFTAEGMHIRTPKAVAAGEVLSIGVPALAGHTKDEDVRLSLLVSPKQIRLTGYTFENCRILGPAVLLAMGTVHLLGKCLIDGGKDAFWTVYKSQKIALGVIEIEDCTFVNCEFVKVGFVGKKEDRERWIKTFFPAT